MKARIKELEAEAYQVLPAIMERIQQHTANNTPQHSYNHVVMDEATQTAMEERRKHTQPGVWHIYSDGSVVNLGRARRAMAFAVVGEQQPAIQGTTKGFASSVKAESWDSLRVSSRSLKARTSVFDSTIKRWSNSSMTLLSTGGEQR